MRVRARNALGLLVVGLLVTGAIAVAGAAVQESSTIHACVNTKSGVPRLVGSEERCRANETRTSWSRTGPRGRPGEPCSLAPDGERATLTCPGGSSVVIPVVAPRAFAVAFTEQAGPPGFDPTDVLIVGVFDENRNGVLDPGDVIRADQHPWQEDGGTFIYRRHFARFSIREQILGPDMRVVVTDASLEILDGGNQFIWEALANQERYFDQGPTRGLVLIDACCGSPDRWSGNGGVFNGNVLGAMSVDDDGDDVFFDVQLDLRGVTSTPPPG